ncbi:hypothetical protein PG985_010358 [Apiospora marii]|uniref:uncharacterized protein n=1 Tax=Apiospora marii TaxID=335849 RepID=UPI00312F0EF5
MGLPINSRSSSEREFDDKMPNTDTENTTHPDEPGKTQVESPSETNDDVSTAADDPREPSPEPRRINWTAEEESLLVELRESGMKWADLPERLPGRSAISCRLHYVYRLGRQDEI